MSENFAELFEESLKSVEMNPGAIITGVVIDIDKDWVTVHAGLKSEGVISADQFYNEKGEIEVAIGDEVQVALEAVEDGFGATSFPVKKPAVQKAGSNLKQHMLLTKSLSVLSAVRLKVDSLLMFAAYARSSQVH